jgi:hypothetical protein
MSKPCAWCIETSERIDSLEQLQEDYLKLKAENKALKQLERDVRNLLVKRLLPKDRG